jgi:hypothetical protein
LLGFDNPLFAWSILSISLLPAAIDAILQSTFLFGLLLFWLCIFHGLRQTDRGLYRFFLPKFLLVGTMWFSAMTMAILEETNELRDPSFSYQLNNAHYKNFQVGLSHSILNSIQLILNSIMLQLVNIIGLPNIT